MIYLLIILLISELIRLLIHVQLVSLLQWHLSSMQWFIYSHHFIYQWINSSISSHATSEFASITFILNAMIYSLSLLYSSMNLIICSHATSESALMTSVNSQSLCWASQSSSSEFASMTSVNSWSLRWVSQFFSTKWVCYNKHFNSTQG